MYNMIPYKSKVGHAGKDIINFFSIRQKKSYIRKEKNYGDDSSMIILDDEHLDDTIIDENTDLRGNISL